MSSFGNLFHMKKTELLLKEKQKPKYKVTKGRTLSPKHTKHLVQNALHYKYPSLQKNDYCFPLKYNNPYQETQNRFYMVKNKKIPLKLKSLVLDKALIRSQHIPLSSRNKETSTSGIQSNSFVEPIDDFFFFDLQSKFAKRKMQLRNIVKNQKDSSLFLTSNNNNIFVKEKERILSPIRNKHILFSHVNNEIEKDKIINLKKNTFSFDFDMRRDNNYKRIKLLDKKISEILV